MKNIASKRRSCILKKVYLLTSSRISRHCPELYAYDIISYPLFASTDTGIYPHAASQYHARPKAKRGIVMLSVDKFPYPRKQTRGNEFIPCSNNICDILKRFRSFKIPAITWIWPKSPYKQRVLMHGHQGWNVRHGLCHIYMIYVYIWVVYSFCLLPPKIRVEVNCNYYVHPNLTDI